MCQILKAERTLPSPVVVKEEIAAQEALIDVASTPVHVEMVEKNKALDALYADTIAKLSMVANVAEHVETDAKSPRSKSSPTKKDHCKVQNV